MVGYAAYSTVIIVAAVHASNSRQDALNQVQMAHSALKLHAFEATVQQCHTAPDQLACVTAADAQLAAALRTFKDSVDSIDQPFGTEELFGELSDSTESLAAAFDKLGTASTATEYAAIVRQEDLPERARTFDLAYSDLVIGLSGSR